MKPARLPYNEKQLQSNFPSFCFTFSMNALSFLFQTLSLSLFGSEPKEQTMLSNDPHAGTNMFNNTEWILSLSGTTVRLRNKKIGIA